MLNISFGKLVRQYESETRTHHQRILMQSMRGNSSNGVKRFLHSEMRLLHKWAIFWISIENGHSYDR